MYPLCLLLNLLPVVLVEPGRVSRACYPNASLPMDRRFSGLWSADRNMVLRLMFHSLQDTYSAHRKEKLQNSLSVYRCHTIFNCEYFVVSFPKFPHRLQALVRAPRASTPQRLLPRSRWSSRPINPEGRRAGIVWSGS